jgi:uncharacterized spore protein YtfJ
MVKPEIISTGTVERLIDRLNAAAVFGTPTVNGETTVIPVAAVRLGFGYGGGTSGGAGAEMPSGSGGGGGGGGMADPRGYITIGPKGVHYEATVDAGKVALAGIFMVAWSIFWIGLTIREVARRLAAG